MSATGAATPTTATHKITGKERDAESNLDNFRRVAHSFEL